MIRDSDYEFIRKLVYERSRINLGPDKRELVTARLNKRLRATGIPTISDYCKYIKQENDEDELCHLIDAISTNHTYFFREKEHFDFLTGQVLPEMAKRRVTERWPAFLAWSAACSSGEEPYTIAITLAEFMRKLQPSWTWKLEATDISHRILAKAKAGIYREDAVSKVPKEMLLTYFQRGFGPQDGNFRVRPNLGERISFSQLNLLESEPSCNDLFHVVFCRNVMIYFDHPTQEQLVNRLSRRLIPGGYLLVGHSESLTAIRHDLTMVRPAIYRKPL
ncbi:MAG: protein-glutamate O-methyltransferase [Opitutaceae bacterium]|jgi:chemotaxis protein methyltransferase CheR